MIGPDDRAALESRRSEIVPASAKDEGNGLDLEKLARVLPPLMQQWQTNTMEQLREQRRTATIQARQQLELRRLELECAAKEKEKERDLARQVASVGSATRQKRDAHRFWLALALTVGFIGIAVALVLTGNLSAAAFVLLPVSAVIGSIINPGDRKVRDATRPPPS